MFRTDDSEIWFSWNPSKETDPVDKLLRGPNPPPRAAVVEVNYADNPWFPSSLREEMEYDRGNDLDKYAHIWLGKYRTISAALIFKDRVKVEAFQTPELHEIDRFYYGVDWGFAADPTAIVRCFIQGECLFIDHEAFGHGVEIDETDQLFDMIPEARRWPLKADSSRPETISYMARHGFDISAAAKWPGSVEDGIAYLKGFRQIIVHERCKNLIEELRLYSYKIDPKQVDAAGQPVILPIIVDKHNHGIDALRYALDGYITQGDFDINTFIRANA
jgi:phage terminase large subunit